MIDVSTMIDTSRWTDEDRAIAERLGVAVAYENAMADECDAWFMDQLTGMRADGYTPAECVEAYEPR